MQEAAGTPKKPKYDTDTVHSKKNKVEKEEEKADPCQPLTPIWYCDVGFESEHCALSHVGKSI